MPKLTRNSNIVKLSQPGMDVEFNANWGGAPNMIKNTKNGITVTWPMAGAGNQVYWNFGQDPTQSGPTGIDGMPATLLGKGPGYYLNETSFVDSINGRACTCGVRGMAPLFWAGLEGIDDCFPTDPRGTPQWKVTNFNGLPRSFTGTAQVPSGIVLIGNEMVTANLPWYQRVCKIQGGNTAFYVNVSMKNAKADGLAAVYFNKQADYVAGNDINTVYSAPGCALFMNKSGGIDFNNNGVVTHLKTSGTTQNAVPGTKLEVRDYGSGVKEIFIDNTSHGIFKVDYPGEAVGLFAQGVGSTIDFSYGYYFDAGTEFSAQYSSTPRNTLLQVLSIYRCKPPFSVPMFRTNLPTTFIAQNIQETSCYWNKAKQKITFGGAINLDQVNSVYAGKLDGSAGVFVKLLSYTQNAPNSAHAGIWTNNIAFNNLNINANQNPEMMSGHEIVTEMAPEIRLDLL